METKINDTKETYTKQKYMHRHGKQTYGYQKGKAGGEGINLEFEINIYTLLYIKYLYNQ